MKAAELEIVEQEIAKCAVNCVRVCFYECVKGREWEEQGKVQLETDSTLQNVAVVRLR